VRANPSTIAVCRHRLADGLFFVRRDKTCMVGRISSSRPITDQFFPASQVGKITAIFLGERLGMPSGSESVTR
jgi:hypothetical protein